MQSDLFSETAQNADPDPAARWRNRAERNAAWAAWVDAGSVWEDLPGGMTSYSIDRCRPKGRTRW